MIKIICLLLPIFVYSSLYGMSCIELISTHSNHIDINVVLNEKEYKATIIFGCDLYLSIRKHNNNELV